MKEERWRQIDQIFNEAVKREPNERKAFLDRECAGDSSFRKEIETLIRSHDAAGSFLENQLPGATAVTADRAVEQLPETTAVTADLQDTHADTTFTTGLISVEGEFVPGTDQPRIVAGERRRSRSWFLWLALSLGGAVFGCFAFGAWVIVRDSDKDKIFGWDASLHNSDGRWIISGVDPLGPAAGQLHNGDRLLAFNEDLRAEKIGPELYMYFLPPGSAYTVRVSRNPSESEVTSTLHLPRRDSYSFTFSRVAPLIPGLIELLLGLFMVSLRPDYRLARIGFAMCLLWSARMLYLTLDASGLRGGETALFIAALWWVSDNWPLALGCHFVYRFFANVLQEKLWPRLVLLFYAIGVLFSVVNAAWAGVLFRGPAAATAVVSQHTALLNIQDILINKVRHGYEAGGMLLVIAVLTAGYRRVTDSDQRRRVRWLVFGIMAALVPQLATVGTFIVLDFWQGTPAGPQQWGARMTPTNYISLLLIPSVLTYAVVKNRILGIEVVVRQGLRYLLARNVLRVILLLPLAGLILPIVRHPNRPLTDAFGQNSLYLNLTLLIALSVSLKYRGQLSLAIDRRFFREAYDRERVLSHLIGQIADIDSLSEISALVSRQLTATMHLRSISVCFRDNAGSEMRLRCDSASGLQAGPPLPDHWRVLRLGRANRKPLDTTELNRAGWSAAERNFFEKLGTQLVVSIGLANQETAGLLVLGGKKSEEPYSPADQKLLQGIAAQMAVVYERIWLRQQVEVDRRLRNEVLAHVDSQSVDLLKECPTCGVCYDRRAENCAHDGSKLTHTLPVARTIESRYRLDRRLGQGGMGAVFEATDLRLRRKVAIKVLVGALFGNLPALRRFEREAEACACFRHPNIVTIHDFGRIGEAGAYLVMDLLSGTTLRSELKRNGTLAPLVAAEWFNQLLNGVQAAHNTGIAHRDLKPENVFITSLETGGDRVTILDFGLAKLRVAEQPGMENLTMPGTVMGTMGYMSPEQLAGQASDELSDLFSVGVMVFESITGVLPFQATNYTDLVRAMSQDLPAIPGDSAGILRLNGLLRKCLAADRNKRFQTASDLQFELLPALRSCAPGN